MGYLLNRYENGSAYFHEEEREGLAKVCRLAIHSRYDDFVVDGFNVLYNKKPVIYLSAAARPGLGQYLCNQVMLQPFILSYFLRSIDPFP